ncbi:MAG: hypothetical protein ACR2NK_08505 [Mariniblastus sp.]
MSLQRHHRIKVTARRAFLTLLLVLLSCQIGCRLFRYDEKSSNLMGHAPVQNPMVVPMVDRWVVMEQVSDEVDNYFKIYREERIRVLDGIMSEGWIETHPKIGSTLGEPWQKDSTRGFERLHATLQTVRRFAKIRVIPTGNAYQIDVRVFKELEDLKQPVGATTQGQLRFDNSLDRDSVAGVLASPNEGWIPMGRDFSLEQEMLRNISSRLDGLNQILN